MAHNVYGSCRLSLADGAGTVRVAVYESDGSTVVSARSTSGVVELPAGSETYVATVSVSDPPRPMWMQFDDNSSEFSVPQQVGGVLTAALVNAEVVDVIRTDTPAELSAIPAANANLHAMVQLIYMALRNKLDVTYSAKEIHSDAGTVLATKTLSDNGTTYSETKMA